MSQQPIGRSWRFPRPMIEDNLVFLLMLWGGFVAVVIGITLGIAWFGDLTQSVLDPASGVALWGIAILTGYLVYSYLPLYIANGRTRRSAAIEGSIFLVIFSTAAAALMSVSYLLEDVVFRIGGWPREFENEHLFSSHVQTHLVFGEYLILFLVWVFAATFVGAGFYRSDSLGWLLLFVGVLVGNVISTLVGWSIGPFVFVAELLDINTPSLPAGLVLGSVAVLVSVAIGWLVIRDMPLRSKSG